MTNMDKPAPNSYWEHHSGRIYQVLFVTNDVDTPKEDYPLTVVYRGCENGKLWSGRLDDWHRRMRLYNKVEDARINAILEKHDTRGLITFCSICGSAQFESPGGITCYNGHGGAPAAVVLLDKTGINEDELMAALKASPSEVWPMPKDTTNPFQDRSEIQHKDHERIWLEPAPGDSDGRNWCKDKVWPMEEGEGEPTEYVRADILNTVASTLAITGLREAKLKAVLQSLVNDIRGMQPHCNPENYWFGPFSEATDALGENESDVNVEWPNLAISCEEAEKLLKEISS